MKLEFSRQIFERKAQISSFIDISPAGVQLFYADGQTSVTKLIVSFRSSANALKLLAVHSYYI